MLLRYEIRSTEPVRIADNSVSQMGQTATLHYIPGSAVRGAVVGKLVEAGLFGGLKTDALSEKTAFFNAYPAGEKGNDLLPAMKGFYEDKKVAEKKPVQNVVVNGDFTEGWKRSSFGDAVAFDGDTIKGFSVPTGSDLKIKIVGEKVFRNEYIRSGIHFVGYIQADDALAGKIKDVFGKEIILGNARSSGLGRCEVVKLEEYAGVPYGAYADGGDSTGSLYMMLLSDTAMRDGNGEYCGLDLAQLEQLLGVQNLKIKTAATSVRKVCGYNRTWGLHIPSVSMYEKGSVFHLTFDGTCTADSKKRLMLQGIGIRKNEGFGRILFLKDYEKLTSRVQTVPLPADRTAAAQERDEATLLVAAKNYYNLVLERAMEEYVVRSPIQKGRISASRLGVLRGILESNRFSPKAAKSAIDRYYEHDREKEAHQRKQQDRGGSSADISAFINSVFENSLDATLKGTADEKTAAVLDGNEVMGFAKDRLLGEDEAEAKKIDFILKLLKYDNKQEVKA